MYYPLHESFIQLATSLCSKCHVSSSPARIIHESVDRYPKYRFLGGCVCGYRWTQYKSGASSQLKKTVGSKKEQLLFPASRITDPLQSVTYTWNIPTQGSQLSPLVIIVVLYATRCYIDEFIRSENQIFATNSQELRTYTEP